MSLPPVFVTCKLKMGFTCFNSLKNKKKKKNKKYMNIPNSNFSVYIKFHWNTAKVVYLHVISGYFHATVVESNNCDRGPMMCND